MLNRIFLLTILQLLFLLTPSKSNAQFSFQKVLDTVPHNMDFHDIKGVHGGDKTFADFDNDGDLDLIVSGLNQYDDPRTDYYENIDGQGTFRNVIKGLQDHSYGVDTIDFNNDGNTDVILLGKVLSSQASVRLYENDGNSGFSPVSSISLEAFHIGRVKCADYTGDGLTDILLNGNSENYGVTTVLYINNGDETFTEVLSTGMDGSFRGDMTIQDMNNDSRVDVIIHDEFEVFLSNGDGTFTSSFNFNAELLSGAAGDVNGDGFADFLFSGLTTGTQWSIAQTQIYFNDGVGGLIPSGNSVLNIGLFKGAELIDTDGDGDLDVFLVGSCGGVDCSRVFLNDGPLGFFLDVNNVSILEVGNDWNCFKVDFNSDSNQDLMFMASPGAFPVVELYSGDTEISLMQKVNGSIVERELSYTYSDLYVRDVDGDGDSDLIRKGNNGYANVFVVDRNIGSGQMEEILYQGVLFTDFAFEDINNDGLGDYIFAQADRLMHRSNSGSGTFSFITDIYTYSSNQVTSKIQVADFNNDGHLDILNSYDEYYEDTIFLHVNDGSGNFTQLYSPLLFDVHVEEWDIGDLNGDGFLDFVAFEDDGVVQYPVLKAYYNDGTGVFTSSVNISSPFDMFGDIVLIDVNQDGLDDIFFSGQQLGVGLVTLLYLNLGNNQFLETSNIGIPDALHVNQFRKADFNNDGLPDLVCSREYSYGSKVPDPVTSLFINNGQNAFQAVPAEGLDNWQGKLDIGDFNNDGKVDLYLYGRYDANHVREQPYLNTSCSTTTMANVQLEACSEFIGPSGATYTSTGLVVDTISNSFGCDSLIFIDLTIYDFDTTISAGNGYLQSNQVNATSYQWVDCQTMTVIAGETSDIYYPQSNGEYAVIITTPECSDTSECYDLTNLSISENTLLPFPRLYPNPSQGTFTIDLFEKYKDCHVSVLDAAGRAMNVTQKIDSSSLLFRIVLPNGLYFVHVKNEKYSQIIPLIINNGN